MKPHELGAALKVIAEVHSTRRSFGDNSQIPARELDYSCKGGMISLDKEGAEGISSLASQLIHDRPWIEDLCSRETTRFELVDAVKELVCSPVSLDPSMVAERLLTRFNSRPCEFVCVFPVTGGNLTDIRQLNRIMLVPSRGMIPSVLDRLCPKLSPAISPARLDEIFTDSNPKSLGSHQSILNHPSAWYVVSGSSALDRAKGQEKALRVAEEDLGLLRIGMLRRLRNDEPPSIEVDGNSIATYRDGAVLGVEGGLDVVFYLTPELSRVSSMTLDVGVDDAHLDARPITTILNAEGRTGLQEKVYLAYTWLNKALKQSDPRERLLDSIIGMEALLLLPFESRGGLLAERIAFCVGSDLPSRTDIFNQARRLIQMRNRVSHQGDMNVLRREADEATRLLATIIDTMVHRCEKETSLNEFVAETEKQKFS